MTRFLLAFITGYQRYISPLSGPRCGYYPTCSRYAAEAIEEHGPVRGVWLAVRRIARCNPWTRGGVDMVPLGENYRWWGRSGTDASTPTTEAGA